MVRDDYEQIISYLTALRVAIVNQEIPEDTRRDQREAITSFITRKVEDIDVMIDKIKDTHL